MTFVCFTECDRCGERYHSDLTPEGWEHSDTGRDYCKRCKGERARLSALATQVSGSEQKGK